MFAAIAVVNLARDSSAMVTELHHWQELELKPNL